MLWSRRRLGRLQLQGATLSLGPPPAFPGKSMHMPILGSLDWPGGMQGLEAGTGVSVRALIIFLRKKELP